MLFQDFCNLLNLKQNDQVLGLLPYPIVPKEIGKYNIKQITDLNSLNPQDRFQKVFWILDGSTRYNFKTLRALINTNIVDNGIIAILNLRDERDIQSISDFVLECGFEDWQGPNYFMIKVKKYKKPFKKLPEKAKIEEQK